MKQAATMRQIVRRETRCVVGSYVVRICNPKRKLLTQESVLALKAGLNAVMPFDQGVVGLQAAIGERARLCDGGGLVIEWIPAGRVVRVVATDVGIHGQGGVRVDDMGPAWRDVISDDAIALILPVELLNVSVGRLEPGT